MRSRAGRGGGRWPGLRCSPSSRRRPGRSPVIVACSPAPAPDLDAARPGRPGGACWSPTCSLIVAIPAVLLAWAVAHGMGPAGLSVLGPAAAGACCAGCWSSRCSPLGVGDRAVASPRRCSSADRRGHRAGARARLAAARGVAHHAAAGGRRGVPVPRLPDQAIAGWIGRRGPVPSSPPSSPRCCSGGRTAAGRPDRFLGRLAFGLAASAAVALTGGWRPPIALHAVNNVLVFVLAGLLGDAWRLEVDGRPAEGMTSAGASACGRWPPAAVAFALVAGRRLAPGGRSPWPPAGARRRPHLRGVHRPGRTVGYRVLGAVRCRPMGYGVIGSPTVSGSVSLGSSPGTPARKHHGFYRDAPALRWSRSQHCTAPSSSGPGRRPLTAVARVRIPSGLRTREPPTGTVGGSRSSGPRAVRPRGMAESPRPAPSSSGLGRRPLTAVARVRIPSGLQRREPPTGDRSGALARPGLGGQGERRLQREVHRAGAHAQPVRARLVLPAVVPSGRGAGWGSRPSTLARLPRRRPGPVRSRPASAPAGRRRSRGARRRPGRPACRRARRGWPPRRSRVATSPARASPVPSTPVEVDHAV